MTSRTAKQATPKVPSLQQFAQQHKRKKCPVCQLPPKLLSQVATRRRKIVRLHVALEWLRQCGHPITKEQYMSHARAGHEKHFPRGR